MGPVLFLDDFHEGNVLASRGDDGRLQLTGLIDFGMHVPRISSLPWPRPCSVRPTKTHEAASPSLKAMARSTIRTPSRLYTFHRITMWCSLTQLGADAKAGLDGLLRDLRKIAGQGQKRRTTASRL